MAAFVHWAFTETNKSAGLIRECSGMFLLVELLFSGSELRSTLRTLKAIWFYS